MFKGLGFRVESLEINAEESKSFGAFEGQWLKCNMPALSCC